MTFSQTRNIFVDWGTTNLRAYLVNKEGLCVDELFEPIGIKMLGDRTCEDVLTEKTAQWRKAFSIDRVLLVGMVGSEIGWQAVAPLEGPCGIGKIASALEGVSSKQFSSIEIVPGVRTNTNSQASGMMRGEEVQVFGVSSESVEKEQLVCLPGSHSKWVLSIGGEIQSISTFMTGELFQIVREHSVLKESLATSTNEINEFHFKEGLKAVAEGESILKLMFSVRTEMVCNPTRSNHERASFMSGLLIGSEVLTGLKELPNPADKSIVLVGNGDLAQAYEIAFQFFNCEATTVDVRDAFLEGCQRVLEFSAEVSV